MVTRITGFSKLLLAVLLGAVSISSASAQTPTPTPTATASLSETPLATPTPGVDIGEPTPLPVENGVLSYEGIADDIDKHRRGPFLSVRPVIGVGTVKILADASVPNSEFQKYPIRFDFYVNRLLISSQIRSPELPGPVGVDVPARVATIPFNYSVMATVIHPNRSFTTVLTAAVEESVVSTLGCTATVPSSTDPGTIRTLSAEAVAVNQATGSTLSLTYQGTSDDGTAADSVSASLVTTSDTTVSGTLSVGSESYPLTSGTISRNAEREITSLQLSGEDGVTLACE